mmetsp:Transcript_21031/g.66059  ORF Transcript_21031/g.66059 Transcript_21031/m.66059 type:complete len:231 (+) Transcript_21031:719-1411(+)
MASRGAMIWRSRPSVSCSGRYALTFSIKFASCARFSSSQKYAGAPVALARATANRTQSWIGESFVWHMRQMSPSFTSCDNSVSPVDRSTTRIDPAAGAVNVLGWLPYSWAFWAMRPTFATAPIVAGSNAPCSRQWSTTSAYDVAYVRSGMTYFVSFSSPSGPHILPESRKAAGIDASMMMSLGTWRFVMPLSESTMASGGRTCEQSVRHASSSSVTCFLSASSPQAASFA